MTEIATATAWALAAVFAVAAVAKAVRPAATAGDLARLGVPLARPVALLLPAAEGALAVGLVLAPRTGGLAALGLLAVFQVVLVRAVRSGRTGRCACFGAAGDDEVSGRTLVRNGLLAVAAAVSVAATEPSVPGLAAVVTVSCAWLVGALVLALVRLRHHLGVVWSVALPGSVGGGGP